MPFLVLVALGPIGLCHFTRTLEMRNAVYGSLGSANMIWSASSARMRRASPCVSEPFVLISADTETDVSPSAALILTICLIVLSRLPSPIVVVIGVLHLGERVEALRRAGMEALE